MEIRYVRRSCDVDTVQKMSISVVPTESDASLQGCMRRSTATISEASLRLRSSHVQIELIEGAETVKQLNILLRAT